MTHRYNSIGGNVLNESHPNLRSFVLRLEAKRQEVEPEAQDGDLPPN